MGIEFKNEINANIKMFEDTFEDCADIVARKMPIGENSEYWVYITYIDGLVDRGSIENNVIYNLVNWCRKYAPNTENYNGFIMETLKNCGISSADISETYDFNKAKLAVLSGDCVIIADKSNQVIIFSSKGWPNRGIQQPDTEMVLQGPKEAFTEGMRMNTTLIRRRIRDSNLKMKPMIVGRRSSTDITIVYMKDIVRQNILNEVIEKISAIDIDAILDSGYIEQFIEDRKFSPFPQTQVTERPDKVASAVLEGRIGIIVDNSPYVIMVPATFNSFFQASEDYYQRFEIMSILRILRFIAAFLSISLSGLYIALTVFNPSLLPTSLVMKFAAARESIPFPAVVEILIMELSFELLKEAGIRLPGPIGSTLGIVGGLIIGQAAVEAGIVSPVVVIVVAMSGICSFAIPSPSLVNGFRLTKFYIIALCAIFGLFGFWIAILTVATHLVSIKSFEIPYLFPFGNSRINGDTDLKDSLVRFPLSTMKKRPFFANPKQKIRMGKMEEAKKSRKKN